MPRSSAIRRASHATSSPARAEPGTVRSSAANSPSISGCGSATESSRPKVCASAWPTSSASRPRRSRPSMASRWPSRRWVESNGALKPAAEPDRSHRGAADARFVRGPRLPTRARGGRAPPADGRRRARRPSDPSGCRVGARSGQGSPRCPGRARACRRARARRGRRRTPGPRRRSSSRAARAARARCRGSPTPEVRGRAGLSGRRGPCAGRAALHHRARPRPCEAAASRRRASPPPARSRSDHEQHEAEHAHAPSPACLRPPPAGTPGLCPHRGKHHPGGRQCTRSAARS